MTDLSNSPYATRLKKPTALRSSAIPKLSSPTKAKATAAGSSPTRGAAGAASLLPHANTTGALGPPVRGDEHPPPNTPSSPAIASSSPVRPVTRKSVGGAHRIHTPAAATSTPSYAKPTIANKGRQPATAGASALKQPSRSILKKPQLSSTAALTRPAAKPAAAPLTPRRAAAAVQAQAQSQSRSAQPQARNTSQSKLPVRNSASAQPAPPADMQSRPASKSEEAVQAVLASALAAQQLASELQQQEAAVSAPREHRQSGSVVSRHSRQASRSSLGGRLEGAELLDHDVLGDIDDIDTAFDDDALQTDDAALGFAAADTGLETNSAPAASDEAELQHSQPEDGTDFNADAGAGFGSLDHYVGSKAVEEEKTQEEDESAVFNVTEEKQQLEVVELPLDEEKEDRQQQQTAELETTDEMEATSVMQPTEHEAEQPAATQEVESGSTAEVVAQSVAVEAAEDVSSHSRSAHSRSDTSVLISSFIPDAEEAATVQETATAAEPAVTEAHESLAVPTSNFAAIIIDRDPALGSVGAEVTPVTRTPNVTVSGPIIALHSRPADDGSTQAEDEQDSGRHKLDVVDDEDDDLPTRTPAPSAALPPIATSLLAADAAIEIPRSPIAASLVSYDTAALEHEPAVVAAVAAAEDTATIPAAVAVAPAATPAPVPATAAAGHTRVKSVAFSPDVTAFAAPRLSVGSVGSVDDDLDDIDFGADNAPFPVTPQRGSLAHDVVSAIFSAAPAASTAPAPVVAAAAQPSSAAKELEAARAEEDSRRREADLRAKEKAEDDKYEREKAALHSQQVSQQLEQSRKQLFAHYLAGVQCLKLGKKGSPRQTRVYIRETEAHRWVVGWDSKKKAVESAQLLLADCRCVVGGEEGMFLHRKYMGKWADADKARCVSVLSTVRGLDIVLDSEDETNHWIAIMRQLGVKVLDKQREE